MQPRKYTQYGTFSIAAMIPLLIFFVVLAIRSGFSVNAEAIALFIGALITLFILLIFYKITIIVDDSTVSFRLGTGMISKSYKLSGIKSCRPVKNPIYYGIGIRIIPKGWLYNVSGFRAIELQFHDRQSVVRIGTDRPEEISNVIQELLGNPVTDIAHQEKSGSRVSLLLTIIILTLSIPVIFIIISNRETKVTTENNELTIKGMYGMTIRYNEITLVDTISALPKIEMKTNGYSFGKTKIGNFRLTDKSKVKLFIKAGYSPYILIKSKDRVPIYINFRDRKRTVELYRKLAGRN